MRVISHMFGFAVKTVLFVALLAAGGAVGGAKAMYDMNEKGHITIKKTTLAQGESVNAKLPGTQMYVIWKSSNPKVMQAVGSGLSMPRKAEVTGMSAGTAELTATADGVTYRQRITVTGEKYHSPVRIDPLRYLEYKFTGANGKGHVEYRTNLSPGDDRDMKKIFDHFMISVNDRGTFRNGQKVTFRIEYDEKFMDKYNVTFGSLKRSVRVHGLSYRMKHLTQKLKEKAQRETGSEILWFGRGKKQDILIGIYQINGYYHYALCWNADMRGRFSWERHSMNNIVSSDEAIAYIKGLYGSYELEIA